MAHKLSDLLQAVQNSTLRIALERMLSLAGVSLTTEAGDNIEANVTGNVTGNLTGTASIAALLNGLITDTDSAAVAATSGAVIVPVTNIFSSYITNATAAIAATLADGAVGQLKIIKLKTKDTNNMVVTPANLGDGTTITFDATGEVAVLMFIGTSWEVIYTNATVA